GTSFVEAFRYADDVLRQAVQGMSDIITTPGLINRDFSDIRTIMAGMGYAMMGTAMGSGENALVEAAKQAINSPLMEEGGVFGARGVLINITASSQLGIHEVNEACNLIRAATENEDVQINFGVVLDEKMGTNVKITVIATGFQRDTLPKSTAAIHTFPLPWQPRRTIRCMQQLLPQWSRCPNPKSWCRQRSLNTSRQPKKCCRETITTHRHFYVSRNACCNNQTSRIGIGVR
ncbi:MAG: hypothetical protein JO028_18695, partial [Acidobacteriaceae bacterium]|nr:hypothetical protein [Acidobacteriaceae bacterium]